MVTSTKVLTPLEIYTKHRDEAEFAEVRSAADVRAAAAAKAADLDRRRADFFADTLADPPTLTQLAAADDQLLTAVVAALVVHAAAFDRHNDRIRDVIGMAKMLDLVDLDAPVVVKTNCAQAGLRIEGRPVGRVSGWATRVRGVFDHAAFAAKRQIR